MLVHHVFFLPWLFIRLNNNININNPFKYLYFLNYSLLKSLETSSKHKLSNINHWGCFGPSCHSTLMRATWSNGWHTRKFLATQTHNRYHTPCRWWECWESSGNWKLIDRALRWIDVKSHDCFVLQSSVLLNCLRCRVWIWWGCNFSWWSFWSV
jgi:hypothetical protein